MPTLAGQPLIAITTIRDAANAPVTGLDWEILFSRHQSGAAALTTVEETASPGTYLISTETAATGAYHFIASAIKDDQTYAVAGTSHVVSRGSPFEHYAGQAINEVVYLVDASGTGLTGVTFETDTDTANDPSGDAFTVTATAIPEVDGGYLLSVTPDAAGVWSAEVVADTSPERRYRFEATVFDPNPAVIGDALNRNGEVIWEEIVTDRIRVIWEDITEEVIAHGND